MSSETTIHVSVSDLLGTAMTAAKVAATELNMTRERTTFADQRGLPLDRAVSELVQALAETLVAERYATVFDDIVTRDHNFESECRSLEGLINVTVNAARA